jgi:membrane protein YdbS with pleckstrin-like domain
MADLSLRARATSLVERILRVPSEPESPAGAHDSIQVFNAAPGFYAYQLARWAIKNTLGVLGVVYGTAMTLLVVPDFPYKVVLEAFEALTVAAFLGSIPLTYFMVRLDYRLRWYIVTDRSLRIREGLVNVDEKTMSFANIQNVSIRQGPFQRFFGIADVEVRTAGGGGGGADPHKKGGTTDMHLGYFRGVANAEEIRDAVLARVRHLRDTGLGDPDVERHPPSAGDTLAAAHELLEAARALRSVGSRTPRAGAS